MLIDTHSHLNHKNYASDLQQVLNRAKESGISQIIVPGYDLPSSESAVKLAKQLGLAAAVGIHPHDAKYLNDEILDWFRLQAKSGSIVAIGEAGLDYYRDLSPRNVQQRAFRAQIAVAKEVGLPIIVHNRDAGEDTLAILEEERASEIGGVLHCFSEDLDFAKRVIAMGFYIGIAGPVTYKSSVALQKVARRAPLDRIIVETDAPYLTPMQFRGKRNEPAYVKLVADQIAKLRGIPFDAVAKATTANAKRLFGLS